MSSNECENVYNSIRLSAHGVYEGLDPATMDRGEEVSQSIEDDYLHPVPQPIGVEPSTSTKPTPPRSPQSSRLKKWLVIACIIIVVTAIIVTGATVMVYFISQSGQPDGEWF